MLTRSGEVIVSADGIALEGVLVLPQDACGLVLFAHGSGSGRYSRRNRFVAGVLNDGGLDGPVIGMNQRAAARLRCEHRLEIVPGATHLFEEPGKLETVARLARDWFRRHLGAEGDAAAAKTAERSPTDA